MMNLFQDANECWTEIMRMLQQKLPSVPSKEQSDQASASKYTSFIDQYFGGTLDSAYPFLNLIFVSYFLSHFNWGQVPRVAKYYIFSIIITNLNQSSWIYGCNQKITKNILRNLNYRSDEKFGENTLPQLLHWLKIVNVPISCLL